MNDSSLSGALERLSVLHVVSNLERGGIELWLMQMLRHIDRASYQMDFLVLSEASGALAPEIEALGSHVEACPALRRPWSLWRSFSNLMAKRGPYDVVHSHVHHYGGLVLRIAAWHGVPIRIAHSHSDTRAVETGASWSRRFCLWMMHRWLFRYATRGIAVSRNAAEDLFGCDWSRYRDCQIIPCGIDLAGFGDSVDRSATRAELGIPPDALVIGHTGRFLPAKNHRFLLDVAAALFRREPQAHLLLIGDGPLRREIALLARMLGIADRVIFAGPRPDVPHFLQGAVDAFVFPSHREGLGLALIEAQAAGLPCVIATSIPEEADVVPELTHRLSLRAPPELWAERILQVVAAPRPLREEALQTLRVSEFTIERSVARVLGVYGREEPT